MMGKNKLVFNTSSPNEADNTGAYIRASDGTLISQTTTDEIKQRLDVNTGTEYRINDVLSATARGHLVLGQTAGGVAKPLLVNSAGELEIDVSVTTGSDKAEDAVAVSGDIGAYVLSVRSDTLANSTSANGDYQSFKTNSVGALWVTESASSPSTYDAWKVSVTPVSTVAVQLVGVSLTNRKKLLIQNTGNKSVFIKEDNTVATASGIEIAPGAVFEMELSAGVSVYAISSGTGTEVRIAEMAYTPV